MEKVLPKGWMETDFGNYISLKNGYAYKTTQFKDSGIPLLKISNITKNGKVDISNPQFVSEEDLNKSFLVENGDIVIAMSGATTGKFGIYEQDELLLQNQRVGNIKLLSEKLGNKRFVYYLIASLKREIEEKAYGGAQPNISPTLIESIKIPLPPLAEQARIVAKLDALFAQHEVMKKALDRIPQLLKDFRQQVLTQAVTGKLIKPKFIGTIEDYKIKIITGPFGSSLHKSEYIVNGIPIINPSHIKNGLILPDEKISITKEKFIELKSWNLIKGDVILGRRGEMGRAALFSEEIDMLCGTGSIILRSSSVNGKFLEFYLRSDVCINYLINNSVGSTMINLNQSIIKSLQIPIYSLNEQQKIVSLVESLFAKADAIEARYIKLKEKTASLPQALLHKAFKGELVPQLPTDGDAKNLLDEIMALKKEVKCKKK